MHLTCPDTMFTTEALTIRASGWEPRPYAPD